MNDSLLAENGVRNGEGCQRGQEKDGSEEGEDGIHGEDGGGVGMKMVSLVA